MRYMRYSNHMLSNATTHIDTLRVMHFSATVKSVARPLLTTLDTVQVEALLETEFGGGWEMTRGWQVVGHHTVATFVRVTEPGIEDAVDVWGYR